MIQKHNRGRGPSAKRRFTNVYRNGNKFRFRYLNHPKVITEFIRKLNYVLDEGCRKIVLDFGTVAGQYYPSTVVPIVGIIDCLKKDGIEVKVENYDKFAARNIFEYKAYSYETKETAINVVWKFDAESAYSISDYIFECLRKSIVFPKGVEYLANWSLNEVMDNVINHSGTTEGFVMAQLHPSSKHMAFCVYDAGIGIQQSFENGNQHNPHSQLEAINLSIKEGVTSNTKIGQGNGLFGLHSLTRQGDGRLSITSGNAYYKYTGNDAKGQENLPSFRNSNRHTCIDFVIDYSKEMEIGEVLTCASPFYNPVHKWIEDLEDDRGNIRFRIKDMEEGSGTRSAALKLKNQIMNILTEEPKNIILDFSDVKVITSSYADELIAKLLIDLGLFQFNQLIRISNLNQDMQLILQRSVIQRIISSYNTHQEEKGME